MASEIGIRALQQHASDAVRRAAAGETLTITDRGRPVARLVPLVSSPLERLLAEGLASPATPSTFPEPLAALPDVNLGELLAEARADER